LALVKAKRIDFVTNGFLIMKAVEVRVLALMSSKVFTPEVAIVA
jgi:hypothetical protein